MSSHARSTGRLALTLAFVALFGCKERNTESGATESPPVKLDDSTPTATKPTEYPSAAEKVVAQSAGVKEGDLVLISGSDEDLPLLEDIAVEVRKRGADPLVRVASLQLGRRLYDEVPAKYDSRMPEMDMKLWAGGNNEVQFAAFASSPKSTLTVDGKPLIQDGKLLAQEQMAGR